MIVYSGIGLNPMMNHRKKKKKKKKRKSKKLNAGALSIMTLSLAVNV